MKPDVCIYHAPCQDGFTAAWAIWRHWPDVEFVPGVYGHAPPDVTGKRVLLVDFSYKRDVLVDMSLNAAGVVVLDHHKSAQEDLAAFVDLGAPFEVPLTAIFDMNHSRARLAWDYADQDGMRPPRLIEHVEDRDLWRFALPNTREISAVLFSHEYDFQTWNELAFLCEYSESRGTLVAQGKAIERKHHKDVAELLKMTARRMVIGGHEVPVACLPYTMASDAANTLAHGQPFAACYYDAADGRRVFSLRSTAEGLDVSAIATAYGGGGHRQASGFTAPKGWEGDR